MKILFFGDSITDCGRTESIDPVNNLGEGFVLKIKERFDKTCPDKHEIINRGISGNRIVDLLARYKRDCVNYKPDLISILIGVNDVWHFKYTNGVRLELFAQLYRVMLNEIKRELPSAKLILCEPFVLKGTATENNEEFPNQYELFKTVYDYAKEVEKIAREFDIPLVYLQEEVSKKAKEKGNAVILGDGVHPVEEGKQILCDEWLKVFNKYYN